MVRIRLSRVGKKNNPAYRIVVAESSRPVKGKFIEIVGSYNPVLKTQQFKDERITYWISVGAQPSRTVHNILVANNIIEAPKMSVTRLKKKKEESA